MKLITVKEVSNGWMLELEVIDYEGDLITVEVVCTTIEEVKKKVAFWLDTVPSDILS